MVKLSVVISAYNEEDKLPACLESVSFADEIIVIDNESSDKTAQIAKKHKAKVFGKPNNLMLNVNKNYGFSKASGDWILNLDADERVSADLQQEIRSVLENNQDATGFNIPRKNIIFGKWIRHTGWYPDYHLRLFRNGKGRFLEKHVHEKIIVEGNVDTLTSPLIHENYDTVSQFLKKTFLIYGPNEASQLLENGYKFSYADAIRFPVKEFLGRYFAQQGYKDGFHGLMLSVLMAFYHLLIFTYLWEKKGFVDEMEDAGVMLGQEVNRASKEIKHWVYESRIAGADSALKKFFLKLRRHV